MTHKHLNLATGYHFNLPGHSVSGLTVTILGDTQMKPI